MTACRRSATSTSAEPAAAAVSCWVSCPSRPPSRCQSSLAAAVPSKEEADTLDSGAQRRRSLSQVAAVAHRTPTRTRKAEHARKAAPSGTTAARVVARVVKSVPALAVARARARSAERQARAPAQARCCKAEAAEKYRRAAAGGGPGQASSCGEGKGGGGGGGYYGGGGGSFQTGAAGGGGGGGSGSVALGVTMPSLATGVAASPGNASDSERGDAGTGGAAGVYTCGSTCIYTQPTPGIGGRVVVRLTKP